MTQKVGIKEIFYWIADLPLNESIENNVFGTYEVLKLAENIKHLEVRAINER